MRICSMDGRDGKYIHSSRRSEGKRSHEEIHKNWKHISSGTYLSQDRIMVMNILDFIIGDEFLGQLLEMFTPPMEEGCHQKMHNILLTV